MNLDISREPKRWRLLRACSGTVKDRKLVGESEKESLADGASEIWIIHRSADLRCVSWIRSGEVFLRVSNRFSACGKSTCSYFSCSSLLCLCNTQTDPSSACLCAAQRFRCQTSFKKYFTHIKNSVIINLLIVTECLTFLRRTSESTQMHHKTKAFFHIFCFV